MRTSSAAARRDVKYPRHGPFALFFSVWIFSPLLASCIEDFSGSASQQKSCVFLYFFFLYIHFVMLSFVSFFFSAEYMEGLTFFFTLFCFHTRPLFTHTWIFFFESSSGLNQSTITRRIREKKEVLVCIRMLWAYEIFNPSPKARPFVYLFMRISMCNTLSAISLSLFFFLTNVVCRHARFSFLHVRRHRFIVVPDSAH